MSIITDAKAAVALAKALGDAELYRRILDLQGEIIELSQENLGLRTQNQELVSAADFRATITFREAVYWSNGDPTPFCPQCYESEAKQIHLNPTMGGRLKWCCRNCEKSFGS